MKCHLVPVLLGFVVAGAAPATEVVVATLNIHYIYEGQTKMPWVERRDAVVAAIDGVDADLFAFQEMETFAGSHSNDANEQQAWIAAAFPRYAFAATGDPSRFPNTQPIMYRRDRFDVLDQGFFFFSPTPDELYSRPWHGRFPYFATWALFLDREAPDSPRFAVVNVHLDHSSRRNRQLAAELVLERIDAFHGGPVLVAGDFNALASFRAVRTFRSGGFSVVPIKGASYHFGRGLNLYPAIDHVLYSPEWSVVSTGVYREAPGGIWPSDHYPVIATLKLSGGGPTR